jgi:dipeptidyl aminopeptidase/acylaminoacyl peptidase
MKRRPTALVLIPVLVALLVLPSAGQAQGTRADYDRASGLREKWQGLAANLPERPAWIGKTTRFCYRKSVGDGRFAFVVVDAASLTKAPAFDHERLAAALAQASGEKVDPGKLPFFMIRFVDDGKAVQFEAYGSRWKCDLASYAVAKLGPVERRGGGFGMWERGPKPQAASAEAKASPDGQWEAFLRNYNVWIRAKGGEKKDEFPLSWDGGEGDYYTYESMAWSPDSKNLAAYRLRRGYHRVIQYVESSPADQLQPKYWTMEYAKPGDTLDVERPVLFHVAAKERVEIAPALFDIPYEISDLVWRKDGRAFTFEYNQRGHQVYRVVEVDAATGAPRALISEEAKTFFDYSGKKYRHDVADGKEIIWMSERDGWNHLYLYDGATGRVENQITKGSWVVRGVESVDEEKRKIVFQASGDDPAIDPYFVRLYRVNFDGTGLTALDGGNFNHATAWSDDKAFFVDTRSRVDAPPVMELRDGRDGKVLMTVETAVIAPLVKAGWKAPEVFTSKARDGRTDIWGIIIRPTDFNPKKKYPVIEYIYAGPHSSFVPKSFSPYFSMQGLAELGFIVVQIDGMGTSNRSKAFHDVCWKNLADAGFPDRILWHKAVAAKYPWYDITRVGIYGVSAGGQNALGGVLFHPEFYKVSVAACGCHDNRMDKIWWNEQWMGWPLGPEYAASSNVDNAYRLQGKLLLIVGEMDTNVDPASTMQVVNALIKADKVFDLLVVPGANHGMGGDYGQRRMFDFFVRHLLGVEPTDWNRAEAAAPGRPGRTRS